MIGYLWVSLIIDQPECLVCYFLCSELTLFCIELTENCINQLELSNFFLYVISAQTMSTRFNTSLIIYSIHLSLGTTYFFSSGVVLSSCRFTKSLSEQNSYASVSVGTRWLLRVSGKEGGVNLCAVCKTWKLFHSFHF